MSGTPGHRYFLDLSGAEAMDASTKAAFFAPFADILTVVDPASDDRFAGEVEITNLNLALRGGGTCFLWASAEAGRGLQLSAGGYRFDVYSKR